MAMMPLGADPEATLEAAHQLLHNPPGPHFSPSAAEQWHHDINRIIITSINTSAHARWHANHPSAVTSATHSLTPMVPRVPSVPRVATAPRVPVASFITATLRAELERCRSGEDNRITIKRRRERRRNLDGDFSAADVAPVRQAAHTPTSLSSMSGCMTLVPHLCMVVWPPKFQPHLPEKYDGSVNPTEFLQIYTTSILTS
jgi:hypothetical protein